MKIRTQLSLTIFAAGSLSILALVANSHLSARDMLYGRMEERADALLETVENLALPYLRGEGVYSLRREIKILSRLSRVEYIKIYDQNRKLAFDGKQIAEVPHESLNVKKIEFPVKEFFSAIEDPVSRNQLGWVKVAMTTQGLEENLQNLAWRSIAIGSLSLAGLGVIAWIIGALLGRKLELLTEAVESLEMDKPLNIKEGGTNSEIDRLSRKFSALHARLLEETRLRKKLEAFKKDLTNMLIHDMKQPLTVLKAVLAILAGGDAESSEGKEDLFEMADRSIKRQDVMIENLLQLARLKNTEMPMKKEGLSLKSFVEECADESAVIMKQARRRWSMEIGEGVDSRWILGDKILLKRLVGNLVLNAVEHTPEETEIVLGARLCESDRSRAEIFVRDEGSGISREQREIIFRKYGTFAESAKNVGLGLAFCKMVAEKHSARLELLDCGKPGATFALVIPTTAVPASAGSAAAKSNGPPQFALGAEN